MKNILFLLMLSVALFSACENNDNDDDDNNNNNQNTNTNNVVIVDNDIEQVTTWSGDSIYIIKAYDFYVSNTLEIEPGAIIKFHPSEGPYMMLGSSGTVIAEGTAENPIIFTSYKDDAHGGDQNGDGDLTSPAPKDWGYINTNSYNGSRFEYCEFYYGGGVSNNSTLQLYGSNIHVKHCKFIHNDGGYDGIGVLDATYSGTGTVIQHNIFYNNIRPLSISTAFGLDSSNVFHNPEDASDTNQYNGIFVYSSDDVNSHISWTENEVPYVIDDNDWHIRSGATLTLGDYVVLKFRPSSTLVLVDGPSALVNYNGTGVYFTSYKDDTKKGDTNADGGLTSASANDWHGIRDDGVSGDYVTWGNIYFDSY